MLGDELRLIVGAELLLEEELGWLKLLLGCDEMLDERSILELAGAASLLIVEELLLDLKVPLF